MQDFGYIRKELMRNGVNKKLLWYEYMEECRQAGEDGLQYSQFCWHIQQEEQKHRATMHIPRKPGEQIEVDWAGDPARIIDPDTGEIKVFHNNERIASHRRLYGRTGQYATVVEHMPPDHQKYLEWNGELLLFSFFIAHCKFLTANF